MNSEQQMRFLLQQFLANSGSNNQLPHNNINQSPFPPQNDTLQFVDRLLNLNSENGKLKQRVKELEKKNESLEKQNKELKIYESKYKSLEVKLGKIKDERDALLNEQKSQKQKFEEDMENLEAEYKNDKCQLYDEIEEKTNELEKLRVEHVQMEEKVAKLETDLEEDELEIGDLQEQYRKMYDEKEELGRQVKRLNIENEKLQKYRSKYDRLSQSFDLKLGEMERLEKRERKLEARITKAETTEASLRDENDRLRTKIKGLETHIQIIEKQSPLASTIKLPDSKEGKPEPTPQNTNVQQKQK